MWNQKTIFLKSDQNLILAHGLILRCPVLWSNLYISATAVMLVSSGGQCGNVQIAAHFVEMCNVQIAAHLVEMW